MADDVKYQEVSSTDVFWQVDGVSLQTYAWNIESWGGTRQSPAPLRGDDVQVPYLDGQLWVPKVIDSQTITLAMWVIGAEPDGSVPAGPLQAEFERNWRELKRLLWNPYRQVALTKQWYEDDTLFSATAMAEFAGGLDPEVTGDKRAQFTVDLRLADPFFYGRAKEGYRWTAQRPKQYLRELGDVKTRQLQVKFKGPLNSPSLASPSGEGIGYLGVINSGQVVTINVATRQATLYTPGYITAGDIFVPPTLTKVVGNVVYTGDRHWMQLQPFSDELTLTTYTGSNGGSAEAVVIPSWI